MDTHFFIEKISALKKDFYPIRPGLLDAKAHLDIYKCVAGCTAFQFCDMVFRVTRVALMFDVHGPV